MSETYIFFDVDGVLIDGFHSNASVAKRWDEKLRSDFGIDPDVLAKTFFEGPFMDVIVGKRDCKEALDTVLASISNRVTANQLIEYWFRNDSNINHAVLDIVRQLSLIESCKLYIATNQEHYRAKYLWNELKFKDHFIDIYYSAQLGCLKRDPLYFQKINEELGLEGKTVLFFDDSPDNIDSARQAGWEAVLFKSVNDLTNHPIIHKVLS